MQKKKKKIQKSQFFLGFLAVFRKKVTLKTKSITPMQFFRLCPKKATLQPAFGPTNGQKERFERARRLKGRGMRRPHFLQIPQKNNMSGLILAHFQRTPRPVDFRVGRWVCEGSGEQTAGGAAVDSHRRQLRLLQA